MCILQNGQKELQRKIRYGKKLHLGVLAAVIVAVKIVVRRTYVFTSSWHKYSFQFVLKIVTWF